MNGAFDPDAASSGSVASYLAKEVATIRTTAAAKITVVLVAVGVLGAACSSGSNSASPTTSTGAAATAGQGAAKSPVKPCKSSLMSIFAAPTASPANYLFAPATGKTTPQDAINEVVGSELGQGLIAMCPYMNSLTAFEIIGVATSLTGATPGVENALLNGSKVPAQKVTITDLNCKKTTCSAHVSTSSSTSSGSSSSTGSVKVTKFGSAWFVSQYRSNGGSGSANIGS